jgi:hypothetical protein
LAIETINDIQAQLQQLIDSKQKALDEYEAGRIMLRAELSSLQKAALSLAGTKAQAPRAKKQRYNGEVSRTTQVLEVLQKSTKALDLGALAKAVGLEDNAQNRTKINATLTPMLKGHDSPVIRVSPGIYAARTVGEVRA